MSRFVWAAPAVVGVCGLALGAEHTRDSLDTVKQVVADGKAVLVDVREADEWQGGRLKGAKHFPLSELRAGVPADRLKAVAPPARSSTSTARPAGGA